jgi:hypothetical protein
MRCCAGNPAAVSPNDPANVSRPVLDGIVRGSMGSGRCLGRHGGSLSTSPQRLFNQGGPERFLR